MPRPPFRAREFPSTPNGPCGLSRRAPISIRVLQTYERTHIGERAGQRLVDSASLQIEFFVFNLGQIAAEAAAVVETDAKLRTFVDLSLGSCTMHATSELLDATFFPVGR